MQFLATTLALGALAVAAPTTNPITSTNFFLKTEVTSGNASFDGLYLSAYHSGAGFNDAVLLPDQSNALVGYLVQTNSSEQDGHYFYNQQFNSGSDEPYELVMDLDVNTYAEWQPTGINYGGIAPNSSSPNSGFWLNTTTGLQWSSSPANPDSNEFVNFLVCQWWRGVPQLFFNVAIAGAYGPPIPTCAKVNLLPLFT